MRIALCPSRNLNKPLIAYSGSMEKGLINTFHIGKQETSTISVDEGFPVQLLKYSTNRGFLAATSSSGQQTSVHIYQGSTKIA